MLQDIINGWKNYFLKSHVSDEVAVKRAQVCAGCPYAKKGRILSFLKDELQEIEGVYCTKCGCPLSAKVRSTDICPIHKW